MSARSLLVKSIPCVCCKIRGMDQPLPTEAHHLLLGGLAGQRRLGDEHTVAICAYHHRSALPPGMGKYEAQTIYGPSLADGSKLFRQVFPDDAGLLELTQAALIREGLLR